MRERSRRKQADDLVAYVRPLLELFAEVDDVFSEPEAFGEHMQHSMGRLYRSWQKCRAVLDPDFNKAEYKQQIKSGVKFRRFTASSVRTPRKSAT